MSVLSDFVFNLVTSPSFQYPSGERLRVQIYMYIHKDEFRHGYKVCKDIKPKHKSYVFKYFDWAKEKRLLHEDQRIEKGKLIKGYKLNDYGIEFVRYQFIKYEIPLTMTLKDLENFTLDIRAKEKENNKKYLIDEINDNNDDDIWEDTN